MGVELNIKAWWIGTKDSIKRDGYSALPGRIGGLVRDAKAFYFDEPVVGMVNFGYMIGKGRRGKAALVTGGGQLGRNFSMYDSALRYAAKILSGEIEGDFREAIEQAKQWKKIEEQILALKDGESLAFLTPKGKETRQGVAFTTVRRVGNKFDLTSRLLPPEIDNDSAIQLFKEFIKGKGELVVFGNEKNKDNALYMGVKGVGIDVRSMNFDLKVKKVLGGKDYRVDYGKKLETRLNLDLRIREFEIKRGDFSAERLMKNIEIPAVARETGKIRETSFKLTDEVEKKEKLIDSIAKKNIEEKVDVRKNIFEEEVFKEKEKRVFADEQKIEVVEIAERGEAIILEEKKAVAKSFEVPEVNKKLGEAEEVLIFFQTVKKAAAMPIISVLVEQKKGVLKTFEMPEWFDEKLGKNQENVREITENVFKECVTEFCDHEKKEIASTEMLDNQKEFAEEGREVTTVDEENGEELLTEKPKEFTDAVSDTEDLSEAVNGEESGSEKVEFISEQIFVDGVVDYGRVIFDAKNFTVKKPKIIGEILIPKIILQKPKVFKIPRVISDRVNFGGVWEVEEGRKMMFLDNSFISGGASLSLTIFVPAILWWIDELSFSFY